MRVERPILFSGPMVRAILDGRKTQTRRVVKGEALKWLDLGTFDPKFVADPENHLCPYGIPGHKLWVRETFGFATGPSRDEEDTPENHAVLYRSTWDEEHPAIPLDGAWKPSIHMPRWASRIMLEVISVRIERLQDITVEGALSEGMTGKDGDMLFVWKGRSSAPCPRAHFNNLWDSLNADRGFGWAKNPFVWVIEFSKMEQSNRSMMNEKRSGT